MVTLEKSQSRELLSVSMIRVNYSEYVMRGLCRNLCGCSCQDFKQGFEIVDVNHFRDWFQPRKLQF